VVIFKHNTMFAGFYAAFEKIAAQSTELDHTVECLTRALALHDSDTEEHARRVTALTFNLARSADVPLAELINIRRGAMLHDIGKIGIPDFILRKDAPLTSAEQDIMRMHPTYAYELLSVIPGLHPALDIPYCHHEKWDGTGYPRGLKGEQIPFAARLFAVVDVWDALLSDRPYRPAWTMDQAREYILEQAGAHFDSDVARIFLEEIVTGNLTALKA